LPMWKNVDPKSKYHDQWDRLAGVSWIPGKGEPRVANPEPDTIQATFDACSTFAQKHVNYVLSDLSGLTSPCLQRVSSTRVPNSTLTIYDVVPSH